MHPAIQEELDMLRERFPGKVELTMDDYAEHNGIRRRNAPRHFHEANNRGQHKIGHKKLGNRIIIPMVDYAYWLAQQKIVDGHALILPCSDIKQEMKRRRGFGSRQEYEYRKLG